ncbi:MAG: hypothetical protein AB1715_05685, partial [Acidobacteriota bacterium]
MSRRLERLEKAVGALAGKLDEKKAEGTLSGPFPPDLGVRLERIEASLTTLAGRTDAPRREELGGAGGEVGELLRAVREQIENTELDRQIRDQLEKAWRRAEDLEKRLLAFYEESVRRAGVDPERIEKAVSAGLESVLSRTENVRVGAI